MFWVWYYVASVFTGFGFGLATIEYVLFIAWLFSGKDKAGRDVL